MTDKRKQQISRSVKKHRQERDRIEVYIPLGWRDRLKEKNAEEGISTSDWIRRLVAERIGEGGGE